MANELQEIANAVKADLVDKKADLQAQVNQMANEANRRLDDLIANEMDSPAFSQWVKNGEVRFGVQGKTYQEVQAEYWRTKNFLDAKTSTVKGAQDVLDQISRNTGFTGNSGQLTQDEAREFFKLADKISEYYEMTGESAKALDYQLIWEQINTAIQKKDFVIDGTNAGVRDIEEIAKITEKIEEEIKAIEENPVNALDPPRDLLGYGGFGNRVIGTIKGVGKAIGGFFKGLFKR